MTIIECPCCGKRIINPSINGTVKCVKCSTTLIFKDGKIVGKK